MRWPGCASQPTSVLVCHSDLDVQIHMSSWRQGSPPPLRARVQDRYTLLLKRWLFGKTYTIILSIILYLKSSTRVVSTQSHRYPKVPQGWNSEGEKDILADNWGAPVKDHKHKLWTAFRSVGLRNTPEKNIWPTWAELQTQSTTATVLPEKLTSVCTKETAPLPEVKK